MSTARLLNNIRLNKKNWEDNQPESSDWIAYADRDEKARTWQLYCMQLVDTEVMNRELVEHGCNGNLAYHRNMLEFFAAYIAALISIVELEESTKSA